MTCHCNVYLRCPVSCSRFLLNGSDCKNIDTFTDYQKCIYKLYSHVKHYLNHQIKSSPPQNEN